MHVFLLAGVQPDMELLAKAAELKQDMHHEEAGII